jgi:hypothetical protein
MSPRTCVGCQHHDVFSLSIWSHTSWLSAPAWPSFLRAPSIATSRVRCGAAVLAHRLQRW